MQNTCHRTLLHLRYDYGYKTYAYGYKSTTVWQAIKDMGDEHIQQPNTRMNVLHQMDRHTQHAHIQSFYLL